MPPLLQLKSSIEQKIHGEPVFGENYVPDKTLTEDLHGWFGDEKIYDDIINALKPNMMIEVGSWKGKSALSLTRKMMAHKPDCFTICVDTWLGSYEHRTHIPWREELKLSNGYPSLYRQFLYNVYHQGLTDHILPLPLPSDQAAILLKQLKLKVPFIYIDAGHDEFNVRADIEHYWDLLLPGGVMLGDDYNPKLWPGLIKAVHDFEQDKSAELQGPIKIFEGKWLAAKAT